MARINSGNGVDMLELTHGGKTHNELKRKIWFLMLEERDKNKQTLFSFQKGMLVATNTIFTQMQATTGFNIFGYKTVAAILKELKHLEHGPMLGKHELRVIDPDTMSSVEKKKL